ncbi:MAG TPA: cytochrome c [Gemmatimonadaceae bacterium]|nr:cytochrome c [Gemmatimonadaceae bacterium]
MMRFPALVLAPALLLAIGCEGQADRAADDPSESTHAAAPHDPAHEAAGDSAHTELALRPIMVGLGAAMGTLTTALWIEDYETMTRSAAEIADHAHISSEELARIQAALGREMADFETIDGQVHDAAVRLHEAADARQLDSILVRLAAVQRGCVACHERFRDRLRTDLDSLG